MPCGDFYCDVCFFDLHWSHMMRLHPYREIFKHCKQCHDFFCLGLFEVTA